MIVRECMTEHVELASPQMSLREAAEKMRDGDFGVLPVGENDRLVGMITDRDIVTRAIADGKDVNATKIRDIMSSQVLYCYEEQTVAEVAQNMGDNQVRRLPVLNREKRLVGILSLGDIAIPKDEIQAVGDALGEISERIVRLGEHAHPMGH